MQGRVGGSIPPASIAGSITAAKNTLSALIDRVRGGDSVLIVDRGIPVARLESAGAAVVAGEGNAASLELVTLDDRLADAARREGFVVLGDPSGGD